MRTPFIAPIILAATLLTSCAVGPNYRRPALQTPAAFRGAGGDPPRETASLADLKWWEVFQDKQLHALIQEALAGNHDLRDAVARVEMARAGLGVARSDQALSLDANGNIQTIRLSRTGQMPLPASFIPSQNRMFGQVTLSLLSFEIDIWGRLRRATEVARANLLAAEENRKAVITTLVSELAAAYFSLCELDEELEITRRTLATRRESLRLIQSREAGGLATTLDRREAEQLVHSAAVNVSGLLQQIAEKENTIALLTGKDPGDVIRSATTRASQQPPLAPPGLPSALLERRPDIRRAEANLIAANARIGIAKAAQLPQFSLTGLLGGESPQLSSLFSGPSNMARLAPSVSQPLYAGGRIRSKIRFAEAERQAALAQYEKTVRTALVETTNALSAHRRATESRQQQELLVEAVRERTRLAYLRYGGGVDTLLHALDADRDQYEAELALARIRLSQLLTVVQLYKALGGGWQ